MGPEPNCKGEAEADGLVQNCLLLLLRVLGLLLK